MLSITRRKSNVCQIILTFGINNVRDNVVNILKRNKGVPLSTPVAIGKSRKLL